MDGRQIKHQLASHFRDHHDRLRSLETRLSPTGGDELTNRNSYVSYGTAGFRGRARDIVQLFYNVGLIAGLRCLLKRRSNLGVVITASHNPVEDNGVKIIDANGNMLESGWEPIVERFCNIPHTSVNHSESMFEHLATLMEAENLNASNEADLQPGLVMLGCDTRPSSEVLVKLVKLGLDAWAPLISYRDYGQLTTPALHFLVGESTAHHKVYELKDYYWKLANGLTGSFKTTIATARKVYDPSRLVVDNSNGVGSLTMKYLIEHESFKQHLPVSLINQLDDGTLNLNCGADFVKTKHLAPRNADQLNVRYASLDGDADRVVYFYLSQQDKNPEKLLHLLDGDKILALFAYFLIDILRSRKLTHQLTLGIVQTAYANGASTDYLIKQLGLKVDCVDTGVKHLHKRALGYDLGVYFEANGHGTIWVSDRAKVLIEEHQVIELKQLLSVLNNYTGDAISDILIVELILNYYDWDIAQWDNLYEDRPSSLIKVEIEDRNLVQTTDAGRVCQSPAALQQRIDELVGRFGPNSRSFVRASGTEDVVRIYAECQSQHAADKLARLVGEAVIEMCNK